MNIKSEEKINQFELYKSIPDDIFLKKIFYTITGTKLNKKIPKPSMKNYDGLNYTIAGMNLQQW
jgi:hypothetical protein